MSNGSDLEIYSVYFDERAYMQMFTTVINSYLDILSGHMFDTICEAIAQNSEASGVMIETTLGQVKEISRSVTNQSVEIEVGIDEGDIGGGIQTVVRVLVTLHGNGQIWTKPGESTWKKDVTGPGPSMALSAYRIPGFEQRDHSGAMMRQFNNQIKKYADEFLEAVVSFLQSIDLSQFLRIG